jgi:hypothetical protein
MVIDNAPCGSADDAARQFPGVIHGRLFAECDPALVLVLKLSDEPHGLVSLGLVIGKLFGRVCVAIIKPRSARS